jgi:tetratricopeptide (TPR) repeat protein
MRSLYDLLGVRADDDEQAITEAFRKAAKAHHPDLNPDDPDAVLRFRQIISASTILRDVKQRAAYDQLLEFERQQIKQRLDHQRERLQRERRETWLKRIGATAAVVIICCGLMGAYLFRPVLTNEPAASGVATVQTATIVETMHDDKVAAFTAAEEARENGAAEAKREVNTGGVPSMARADAEISDVAFRTGAVPFANGAAAGLSDPDPASARLNAAKFYRGLGVVAYRLGDFPGAIVNLDEAIRLDPNDARSLDIRGNVWDEMGAFDNAFADYEEAIRIDPNNATFFHDRAILWHRKGELDKALLDLDRAIRFSFSDPDIYCDRGLVWYEKGRHERAIADFNQAVKLDLSVATACINRGLILHRNSDFAVAFAELGKMIHVSPDVFDLSRKLK